MEDFLTPGEEAVAEEAAAADASAGAGGTEPGSGAPEGRSDG